MSRVRAWRWRRILGRLVLVILGLLVIAALGGAVAWARGDIQRHLIARDLDAFYATAGRGDLAAARRAYPLYRDDDALRCWVTAESAIHGPPLGVRIVDFFLFGIFHQVGEVTLAVRYADGAEEHASARWFAGETNNLPTHTVESVIRGCTAGAMPGDFGAPMQRVGGWTLPFTATDAQGRRQRYTAVVIGRGVSIRSADTQTETQCGTLSNCSCTLVQSTPLPQSRASNQQPCHNRGRFPHVGNNANSRCP